MNVMISTRDGDAGLVDAKNAKARAQRLANEANEPVTIRDATSDKVLKTVKPRKRAKAKKPAKPKGPRGMVVAILKLSSRANGVSPAELNKLTQWKGAPWKWLFSNPKKNGYCDRWNLSFRVVQQKDGSVRYCTKHPQNNWRGTKAK